MDDDFLGFLSDNGYGMIMVLPAGRWAGIFQFAFTWAIIVGRVGDKVGYDDRWCYSSANKAAEALLNWHTDGFRGEPKGWHRHPATGRRVSPSGEEYVAT
jgi:hypothetical protein